MADNDFFRQKREREFQQRVLIAVERPKRSRVWEIVNSRLFSVLVLGIFVAALGGYFTQHQQCVREGKQTIDSFKRLGTELSRRRFAIFNSIKSATAMQEVYEAIRNPPVIYGEFRDKSLFQLDAEFLEILYRIEGDYRRIPELSFDKGVFWSDLKYTGIWEGSIDFKSVDLPGLKRFSEETAADWIRTTYLAQYSTIEPKCSPMDLATAFLGNGTIRLTGNVSESFWTIKFDQSQRDRDTSTKQ